MTNSWIGQRRVALMATVAPLSMLLSAPALAQDQTTANQNAGTTVPATQGADQAADQSAAPASAGGDIVVTGSRISNPNLTSASPISVVTAEDIQIRGGSRIEDVLNTLPQSFATQTSSVSNGSTGTATLNLRNLGDQRTLVLVNGRRLMPGDPVSKSSAADVNVIPQALIKRVDVLTGGASSVYGSDAVAGVVNFVLDTDYKGLSLTSSYGLYNHNNDSARFQGLAAAAGYPSPSGVVADGQQFDVNLKLGTGTEDGKGHIVGYMGYREIQAITQGRRDYSACSLNAPAGNTGADYRCGGSATAAPANFTLGDAVQGGPPTSYTLNSAGQLVPGTTLYNANPLNYYQRPDKRFTAGFMAHYDVSDALKPYAEFNFMDDRTVAQIAPSGDFSNTQTLNCNNPLLSALQVATFCRATNLVSDANGNPIAFTNPDGTTYNKANVLIGRRNVEGGGRQADITHTSYRFVLGVRGDLDRGISYDAYGQYGTTKYNLIYRNEFSVSKTTRALDVIGTAANPVCRSVVDGSDPNCVPLNIFGAQPITAAALNYVQQAGFQQGQTKETVVSGAVNFRGGEYGIQSPWSDEGIGLSIGAEYRKEQLSLEVDQAFQSGDLAGQGGPTLPNSGQYDVKEVFGEIQIPLVTDRPFFHELTLEGGYRFSHYSTAGSVSSYKGQLTWAPVRDLTFRGGYNRAVRAPNIQELFVAQSVQIDGATDPCAGAAVNGLVNGNTAAQCARIGVPANRFGLISANPSEQYNGLVGGNPNLRPETADTFTVGAVLQPSFLRGFTATVDLFSIKVKDIIGVIGADTILNQCLQTGNPTLCGAIRRDANGTLWQTPQGYVVDTNVNAGTLKTRGIDVSANYTLRTATAGTFSAGISGTYVDELTSSKVGAEFDCAGLYGAQCGFPQSKWRHRAVLSWNNSNGIGISGTWRHLSPTRFERTSGDSDLAGSFYARDARVPAQNYFDLAVSARIENKYTLRIGANNLLDKTPPILSSTAAPIGSFGNGNTYPGIYDAAGRYIFTSFTIDL
ncbi:TonB-dependent receptor [uncultured Sphingomonas sp.]|uniref:TonB-dependent receptor domain-containing protein n=1 Tax=uncultured Sphingomonas sp. TaxID=158754 RepID=UPI0025E8E854|nr:TonB-dependent receptor [uncultured Sphingomonas sp.]